VHSSSIHFVSYAHYTDLDVLTKPFKCSLRLCMANKLVMQYSELCLECGIDLLGNYNLKMLWKWITNQKLLNYWPLEITVFVFRFLMNRDVQLSGVRASTWHKERKWHITASWFGDIAHATERRSREKLCRSMLHLPTSMNKAVLHGQQQECVARQCFEDKFGVEVSPVPTLSVRVKYLWCYA